MKRFRRSRDDGRFALTTLQNPACEVRSMAEIVRDAQKTREAKEAKELKEPHEEIPQPPHEEDQPTFDQTLPAAAELLQSRSAVVRQSPELASVLSKLAAVKNLLDGSPESIQPQPPSTPPASSPAETELPQPEKIATRTHKKKSAARGLGRAASNRLKKTVARRLLDSELTPEQRHARKCVICNHPDRQDIEDDFLDWSPAAVISRAHNIPHRRAIYRHAQAVGLVSQRRANLRLAAESIIEWAHQTEIPSADSVLRAIRVAARINDRGEWVEPPSHIIVSSGGHTLSPIPPQGTPAPAANLLPASHFSDIDLLEGKLDAREETGEQIEENLEIEDAAIPSENCEPTENDDPAIPRKLPCQAKQKQNPVDTVLPDSNRHTGD
jgi:hypothetical protein